MKVNKAKNPFFATNMVRVECLAYVTRGSGLNDER